MVASVVTRARIDRAIRRRVALVHVLSPEGVCDICKQTFAHEDLEIDHIDGIAFDSRKMSPQMRAARYWREHRNGVRLRTLCRSCNGRDGGYRRWNKQR